MQYTDLVEEIGDSSGSAELPARTSKDRRSAAVVAARSVV